MDELLGEFIAETRETLEALAGEVVAWEADPSDRARLDAIFRFVHTVKGSCGFLDLPRLARLSHAAEDALAEVRAGTRAPDRGFVTAVLAIIDRIAELTDAVERGECLADGDDELLIAALSQTDGAVPAATLSGDTLSAPRTAARSIRLSVDLLDRLMAGVSDMVLARNELSSRLRVGNGDPTIEVAFERLSQCIAEMRDSITRTRMARIEQLFSAVPRMVRDLAGELGKRVELSIDGGDVELDREMIEMIRDPLTHIVRNALDHGLESAAERRACGKPEAGRLRIGARQAGNQIVIEVADDGRGIDTERLLAKALARGIISTQQAVAMPPERVVDLIFAPGFSTASAVTPVSGRGVGMDVVRANVERIGGRVEVESRAGQGLRITMRVPLTLTIIPALTIRVGAQRFAIPRSAIEEIVRIDGTATLIEHVGAASMARIRGKRMPVVPLGALLRIEAAPVEEGVLVVLRAGAGASDEFALAIDAAEDHEELVVKPASPHVMAAGIFAGSTLPNSSRPMLLLSAAGIATAAHVTFAATPAPAQGPGERQAEATPMVIFADLDGRERAMPLALVERIEDLPVEAASFSAGRMRLIAGGAILPLLDCGTRPAGERLCVLRLSDGETEIAYAVERVIDIADVVADPRFAEEPGLASGVAMIGDRPVELIDPHWLFAQVAQPAVDPDARPLCVLVAQDDGWMRQLMAPLVRAAGYDVAFGNSTRIAEAALVIAGQDVTAPIGANAGVPVIRLRATAVGAEDSIYRYDRRALTEALSSARSGTRATR